MGFLLWICQKCSSLCTSERGDAAIPVEIRSQALVCQLSIVPAAKVHAGRITHK
jgi:hypothetical protein